MAWVNAYYNSFTKRLDPLGAVRRPTRTSPSSASSCAPRPTRRPARAADGSTFFQFALRFYNEHGPVVPGTVSLWDEYQAWKADAVRARRRSTAA